jgi:hypothetical protein
MHSATAARFEQVDTATTLAGQAATLQRSRNAFRGPGFVGGDMSLRKNFSINERAKLQIGLNAYNWLNHANYGVPYPNTNAPFFGETAFMQTPPTSPYGAFAAAATDTRMAQLTAKVSF